MVYGYCYKFQKTLDILYSGIWTTFRTQGGIQEKMNVARKLGILVFTGVPAIIGGGIVYAIFHDLTAILVYEVILLFGVGAYVAR